MLQSSFSDSLAAAAVVVCDNSIWELVEGSWGRLFFGILLYWAEKGDMSTGGELLLLLLSLRSIGHFSCTLFAPLKTLKFVNDFFLVFSVSFAGGVIFLLERVKMSRMIIYFT